MPPVYYHLGKFPPKNIDWSALVQLVGKANAALARYDGLLSAVPDKALLLSPLLANEAVLSSKIEGTHVSLSEVLEVEAGGEPENFSQNKRNDAEEVINYRRALSMCAQEIREKKLSQHMLRQAHAILMRGVRGKDKSPGGYRKGPNWIGSQGCSIDEAGFVSIPIEHLVSGMETWDEYLNNECVQDPIAQLAVIHIEFEALHPFEDGNGRLGRMLIPLFLYQRGLLGGPNFYMSEYFDKNRDAYIEKLRDVSARETWTEWIAFFLEGVIAQAIANERKARNILNLYEKIRVAAADITKSPHCVRAVDHLFHFPVFRSTTLSAATGIPDPTARRILAVLRQAKILHVLRESSGRAPAVYVFPELVNAIEGRDIFVAQ